MGNNPEGLEGKSRPGEGGAKGAGPRIPGDCAEKAKLGVNGGGNWNPGESSGYGDLGDSKFRKPLGDGTPN